MIVLDSSAAVELLLDTPAGAAVAQRLLGERLHMPVHFDVEVTSAMRLLVLASSSPTATGSPPSSSWAGFAAAAGRFGQPSAMPSNIGVALSVAGALHVTLAERLGAPARDLRPAAVAIARASRVDRARWLTVPPRRCGTRR